MCRVIHKEDNSTHRVRLHGCFSGFSDIAFYPITGIVFFTSVWWERMAEREVSVLIGGRAGDGISSAGQIVARLLAQAGYRVHVLSITRR